MWARYDCKTGEREDLIEHLKKVGQNARKIASCLKDVLEEDMGREAEIAGYFHDLFKAIYQPENIDDFCKSNDRLTFRHHEVASAVFLANYLLKVDDLGLSEDGIRRSVKSVLFHHQGLRAISLEDFFMGYNDIINIIKRIDSNVVSNNINVVLDNLGFRKVNDIMSLLDFRALEGIVSKGGINDRFLSGILMVSDNLTVMNALNKDKAATRLLELEIMDYLKAIDCRL